MDLSQEERRKIYEEEKAKIEAAQRAGQAKENIPAESSTSLAPRVAGLLCYLGVWISGIVFIILEQKNRWVRFHAAQSIVVFGFLWIAGMVLGWIPYIGGFFSAILTIIGIILWIVLMVKAYNGERYKVVWAGDLAEMIIGPATGTTAPPPAQPSPPPFTPASPDTSQPAAAVPPAAAASPPPPPPPASSTFIEADEKINRKIDDWFSHRREGRITGSAFAIAWNIIVLVFFNFFHQYVAYYNGQTVNGVIRWTREPFFTSDIGLWLPILNAAIAVSIISHIIMILVDKELLRQALHVIMNGFALATVITLLVIFPFDFGVIPNEAAATGTNLGVTIALIIIAVGTGIGLLVRFIQLLINSVKALLKAA